MGWSICNQPLGCTAEAHMRGLYSFQHEGYQSRVLDMCRHGRTFYVLIRVKEADKPVVQTCVVVLTQGSPSRAGFGWKSIDESMGPTECDCPPRILARLSPVENLPYAGFASAWRQRCAAKMQNLDGAVS